MNDPEKLEQARNLWVSPRKQLPFREYDFCSDYRSVRRTVGEFLTAEQGAVVAFELGLTGVDAEEVRKGGWSAMWRLSEKGLLPPDDDLLATKSWTLFSVLYCHGAK